jgi:ABC-2 type transport system ATP-binding protein
MSTAGRHRAPNAGAAAPTVGQPGISCSSLSRKFGEIYAVRDLTFEAPMGAVTGFVGANGAGKTTTMRMLLGLVEPTSGSALVAGRRLKDIRNPRTLVGPVLDTPGSHPGQTGRAHLRIQAASNGIPESRVDEVLEMVELTYAANRRSGSYSLGMRQRLSLATALLGNPPIVIFDEPTKGLDPPGMMWLREFLRGLADEGRCVFVSSHHLSELEAIADRVVMLNRGRLVANSSLRDLLAGEFGTALVASPNSVRLRSVLMERGAEVEILEGQTLRVSGFSAAQIGDVAASELITLHQLADEQNDLEDIYRNLTNAAVLG